MKEFKCKKLYYRTFSIFISLVMIVVSLPIMSLETVAANDNFEGVFLFNSVKYRHKYIHINNNNNMTDEGEIIELHQYNPYWALRWYIINLNNGYYKIESVWSEKVLTAPTGYNNDIVTQTTYVGANTQQWKFIRQSDGSYKISPRSNSNYFLAAGTLSSTADQDLEIRTVQTDGGDKWYLFNKVISYTNYRDSLFHSSLISNIPYANVFSQAMYARYFNVGLNTDGLSSQYPTIIDNCTLQSNQRCNSGCGSSCSTHHKNIKNISDQIYYDSREDNYIYVLWTDRPLDTYCYNNNPVSALAVVYDHRPVIHFMNLSVSTSAQQVCMALTLMHETAHVFGMDDVYNDASHDIFHGTRCIMEKFEEENLFEFYQAVLDYEIPPFCDSCMSDMTLHTANITINGN